LSESGAYTSPQFDGIQSRGEPWEKSPCPAGLSSPGGNRTPAERQAAFAAALAQVQADLRQMAVASEAEIESLARSFERLAAQANSILQHANAIVSWVDKNGMGSVLSDLQSLCRNSQSFLTCRLDAANRIVGILQQQEQALQQLSHITQRQEAIACHLRALSMLTNIEVAHLGDAGGNFQLLAQELATFSKDLSGQTLALATDAANRAQAITEARNELVAHLPELSLEIGHMENDVARTLGLIDEGLSQQTAIPLQFRQSVEAISKEISGVVAAIQAHDITRQQIEHVDQALQLIGSRMAAAEDSPSGDVPAIHTGLNLQLCQLKNIKETVTSWRSQIRDCMRAIEELSATGVADIGPTVLHQEQALTSQLPKIERLQQRSQDCCGKMQTTLGGLSSLVDLANDHLNRARAIREHLQILMLNALIEAERLDARGAVVSAIARLIKEVSGDWNALANDSRQALAQLLDLVQQTTTLLQSFSESSREQLQKDQAKTASDLLLVRGAAAIAAKEAARMVEITDGMHSSLNTLGTAGTHLDACFNRLDTALLTIEGLSLDLGNDDATMPDRCDPAEVERWLAPFYTTEIERRVMTAALYGLSLPVAQQSFEGNAVELF
jgi:uncharacterized phage infection (PIP) family protein YhgE